MATKTIQVKRDIRAEHLAAANEFRHKMARQGTLVVRLISSPGSGKTALLEKTAQRIGQSHAIGVLVGDVETDRDAQRLAPFAPTVQITTGGACHLEIPLVVRALSRFKKARFDILFIEDVGNLVCPASHDLGEHLRVLLLSSTEGDDKPGKYPKAFRTSDVLVISKADLLPHVPFSVKQAEKDARRIQPALKCFTLSAQTGDGVTEWCKLLERERKRLVAAGKAEVEDGEISGVLRTAGPSTRGVAAKKSTARRVERPKSTITKIGKE
ncbi:MAG: hydrogenase nickel incorporation protein HypB [Pirellulales bacterium]